MLNQIDLQLGLARCFCDFRYAGPTHLFPYNIYPSYMSGTSYCMSADVAEKLLNAALATPIFHLEDVYLTGNVCNLLSPQHIN